MPAYYIAQIEIVNAELYGEVQQRFPSVFKKYSGRVLVADPSFKVIDGEFNASRVVVIEFPTEADLQAWYYSPEYQETVELRRKAAKANIIIANGSES